MTNSSYKLTPYAEMLLDRAEAREELRARPLNGGDPSLSDLRHWHLYFSSLSRRAPRLGLSDEEDAAAEQEDFLKEIFQ